MEDEEMLDKKYADLLIGTGVNLQKGQTLVINADPIHYEFVELLAKIAYEKGARRVVVEYGSERLSRLHYLHQSESDLVSVAQWEIDKYDQYLSEDLCKLALRSPNPGVMADVDSELFSKVVQARGKALERYSHYSMSSQGQWLVCAYPTQVWADTVFPELSQKEAYDKLYEYILYASRVSEDNDPAQAWKQHNEILLHQANTLNAYDFKSIHFSNSLGTDITIGLVAGHIWGGGADPAVNGVVFNANIPTEENFTTPDRMLAEGIVYNTLPLNYNSRIIDGFWLKFEKGEVVDFDAKVGKDALSALLNTDDGSKRMGEIALISNDSPISNLKTLFYNTLFDENASCHIAMGRGYPLVEGGSSMSKDELQERGINQSLIHVDFMFGSADMLAVGLTKNNEEVIIIENGNIVI
jgi:aminopeptidase